MCSSRADPSRRRAWLWPVACLLALTACEAEPSDREPSEANASRPDTTASTPARADSSRIRPGALSAYAYTVIDSARFDADADGAPERVELLATVERNARGDLLWEDGHHWAVLVTDDSVSYPLFERFLPWGRAELLLLTEDAGRPVIVVQTTAPARCSAGAQQTLGVHVEQFTFDATTGAFVRDGSIDASGTGVCLRVDDGSRE